MSLYDDLGIAEDATGQEVKAAHRTAARQHHPDAGGDREAFERIQTAYLVLSDPSKREKYDQTGEVDLKVNNRLSAITGQIMAAFDTAVTQAGTALRYKDLIALTRKAMEHKQAEMKNSLADVRTNRETAKALLKRLKFTGGGFDPIGSVISQRLGQMEAAIPQIEKEIADYREAMAYLDNYGFDFEQMPTAEASSTGSTTYIRFTA